MERPAYLTTLCLVEDLLISEGGIEIADLNPKSKIRNPKSEILTPLNTCVKITVINEALFLSMRSLISTIIRMLSIVSTASSPIITYRDDSSGGDEKGERRGGPVKELLKSSKP